MATALARGRVPKPSCGRSQLRRKGSSCNSSKAATAGAERSTVEDFLDGLSFDEGGLVVAIVQDVDTGSVQMQAFANREAIRATLETGKATFFSRSRSDLWCKGETSGNFIRVESVHCDCDADAVIYLGSAHCSSSFGKRSKLRGG